MPDPGQPAEPVATGTAQEPTPAPAFIVGPDGKFSENWTNALPEELRGEKVLKTFPDFPGAVKMLVHAQRKLGAEKIVKPNEKSSPEDWADYYKAGGLPDTPDAYKIELPKELAPHYSEDTLKEARAVMHQAGLNQKQVDALLKWDAGRLQKSLTTAQELDAQQRASVETDLRKEWGKDFDSNLRIANRLIGENLTADESKELAASVGNNKVLAKLLATVGKNFMEDTPLSAEAIEGPGGLQEQIKQLQMSPGYLDGTMNPAQRKDIQTKLDALYKKAYPSKGSR